MMAPDSTKEARTNADPATIDPQGTAMTGRQGPKAVREEAVVALVADTKVVSPVVDTRAVRDAEATRATDSPVRAVSVTATAVATEASVVAVREATARTVVTATPVVLAVAAQTKAITRRSSELAKTS